MRAATESGTIRTPWAAPGYLGLGALDSMIQCCLPRPAMLSHLASCLLAAIGLVASPLVQAQAPEVSTVLAMSGSRNPDGVVLGPDGALYGAAAGSSSVTGGLFYRVTTDGSSVDTLSQFGGTDGAGPAGALLFDPDDILFYGTTQFSNGGIAAGGGTVFSIAPDGTGFTLLHEFKPSTGNNVNSNPINEEGNSPHGALIEGSISGGSDGFLYGVARFGGHFGTGTVFKLGKDGSGFKVLHEFDDVDSAATAPTIVNDEGAHPRAGLVQSGEYLYGTTNTGGANGQGTIFRLRLDGSEFSILHVFTTPTAPSGSTVSVNDDGALPQAGLTDGGDDGLLYGTTTVGGANGVGVIYSITPDGTVRTTLHDFEAEGGSQPIGTLLLGTDGRLYGTTSGGGETSNGGASTLGVVYSIARDGTGFTKLHDFESATGSGGSGRMVQLNATEFIGTTNNGGRCGNGTIFRLSLTGATITGDTSCGNSSSSGSGGGAMSWSILLMLVVLLAGAAHRRTAS